MTAIHSNFSYQLSYHQATNSLDFMTSPEGNFNVTNFPSFAINFTTLVLANCPLFPSVISMLCMVVPKSILVEVYLSFWSIKTPFHIVYASSKDVDDDTYIDGSNDKCTPILSRNKQIFLPFHSIKAWPLTTHCCLLYKSILKSNC